MPDDEFGDPDTLKGISYLPPAEFPTEVNPDVANA